MLYGDWGKGVLMFGFKCSCSLVRRICSALQCWGGALFMSDLRGFHHCSLVRMESPSGCLLGVCPFFGSSSRALLGFLGNAFHWLVVYLFVVLITYFSLYHFELYFQKNL